MAVLYIYNGHHADKLIRKISVSEKNIKELEYEYKSINSAIFVDFDEGGKSTKSLYYKFELKPSYSVFSVRKNSPSDLAGLKNGDEIKQEGELNLSILAYGTLQTAGYGFSGLSVPHKISILLPIFAVMILVLYVLYNRRERKRQR